FGLFGSSIVPGPQLRNNSSDFRLLVFVEDLATEHPRLHADDPVLRLRFRKSVVDVRAQRVQRHTTLAIPFRTAHFSTAEAARTLDLHPKRTGLDAALDRLLHRAAETDAAK